MNGKLSETDRKDIGNMRGVMSAKEVAEMYGISEKTVYRVWKEGDTRVYARDCKEEGQKDISVEELLQSLIENYEYSTRARDRYRALALANPTNCAWGNLELKFTQECNNLLALMGKWKSIEKKIDKKKDDKPFTIIYDLHTKAVPDFVSKKGCFKEGEDFDE